MGPGGIMHVRSSIMIGSGTYITVVTATIWEAVMLALMIEGTPICHKNYFMWHNTYTKFR
jgi:hypothetical protein